MAERSKGKTDQQSKNSDLPDESQRPHPGGQTVRAFKKRITRTVRANYLLYLPQDYGKIPGKKWPLALFLHGAGERGSDIERVKTHGLPKMVAEGKQFPFILVSPQCPADRWWSSETLALLLEDIQKQYEVDPDQVYLTGISMGGYGTWNLALEHPGRFAAIVPICGGGVAHLTRRIKHVPTWVFHGAKDQAVPIKEAHNMVDALKAAGGDVHFTIYPEAGHDSWTEAYNTAELYEWLLKQRRK